MKINKDKSFVGDHPRAKPKQGAGFASFISPVESKIPAENEFMEDLDHLGKELLLRRSLQALENYKAALRKILQRFREEGFTSKKRAMGDAHGSLKAMQLSRVVDQNMVDLTNQVLLGEEDLLKLAATIDNIKGLLIDFNR